MFLGMAFAGLRNVWYPSIGSDGNVKLKVNFGDEDFMYNDAQRFGVGAPERRVRMIDKKKGETK
jgi:hypothetical protein